MRFVALSISVWVTLGGCGSPSPGAMGGGAGGAGTGGTGPAGAEAGCMLASDCGGDTAGTWDFVAVCPLGKRVGERICPQSRFDLDVQVTGQLKTSLFGLEGSLPLTASAVLTLDKACFLEGTELSEFVCRDLALDTVSPEDATCKVLENECLCDVEFDTTTLEVTTADSVRINGDDSKHCVSGDQMILEWQAPAYQKVKLLFRRVAGP